MALTMSRTRNQTTLTKLATMVANIHGELEHLEGLLADGTGAVAGTVGTGTKGARCVAPAKREHLMARQLKLLADRDALYATVRQFDPTIEPETIRNSSRRIVK